MATKHIFVTGGNAGIGFALCKLLVGEREDTFVFLGSRDAEKGAAAVKSISDAYPAAADRIALVAIDVGDEASVAAAAAVLQAKSVTLYALVNNAGVGFQTSPGDAAALLNVNLLGPKRVSEAILPLIDPAAGRIVNVSSGAASMWLRSQSAATKELFTSRSATWEQLAAAVEELAPAASMGGYGRHRRAGLPPVNSVSSHLELWIGLSKAALTAYTLQQAAAHPNLTITSLSPGYIKTAMTAGSGARLTPEQGTVSMMRCLFGEVTSGYYYGSDALRSPMTVTRDPGTPEYGGEENPDAATYNR